MTILVIKVWDLTQDKKLSILIKDSDSSNDIENKGTKKLNFFIFILAFISGNFFFAKLTL